MALLFGAALNPTYLNKLKLLQNKANRIVTSSHWSTSSKLLYIKTNVLLFPKLFEFETAIVYLFILINLICCVKFLIITFYLLSLAILVPQDF